MRRVTSTGAINKASSLNDVITRMKLCDLEANADRETYEEFSVKLKSIESPAAIAALLSEMLEDEIFPNIVIINQLISILSRRHCLQFVMEFYAIACTKNLADIITFRSTLDAIANSPNPKVEFAMGLLEEAKKKNLVDSIMYNQILTVIAKSKQPDASLANRLLDEAIREYKICDMTRGLTIDLHGMSYGMVYFGLIRRLNQEMTAQHSVSTLTLFYGKGLHTNSDEIDAIKKAVMRVVNELAEQGISGKKDSNKSGRFVISYLLPSPQSIERKPSIATKLNVKAQPYVPKAASIQSIGSNPTGFFATEPNANVQPPIPNPKQEITQPHL